MFLWTPKGEEIQDQTERALAASCINRCADFPRGVAQISAWRVFVIALRNLERAVIAMRCENFFGKNIFTAVRMFAFLKIH